MRKIVLFTMIVLLLSVVFVFAQKTKTDFSGEWTLNADKSEMGDVGRRGGGMGVSKMTVEQKGDKLIVESFRKNRDGDEVSSKNTYTLDGKKCKNEGNFGTTESIVKWGKDGKMLTIESTMKFSRGDREMTMESTEKWSLDNGVLTVETTRSTPRGERTSKAVYDKVKKDK